MGLRCILFKYQPSQTEQNPIFFTNNNHFSLCSNDGLVVQWHQLASHANQAFNQQHLKDHKCCFFQQTSVTFFCTLAKVISSGSSADVKFHQPIGETLIWKPKFGKGNRVLLSLTCCLWNLLNICATLFSLQAAASIQELHFPRTTLISFVSETSKKKQNKKTKQSSCRLCEIGTSQWLIHTESLREKWKAAG